jgi:uncharacterized protein YecT (DUF1311 family)
MNITFKILLPVFLLFPLSIFAQNESPIDSELTACMDKDPSTHGVLHCIDNAYKKWDDELNNYYQKLMDLLDDNAKDKLKEAERKWIEYRDLEFKNIEGIYSKKEGTMYLPMLAIDKMNVIKRRALQLRDYYQLITEY